MKPAILTTAVILALVLVGGVVPRLPDDSFRMPDSRRLFEENQAQISSAARQLFSLLDEGKIAVGEEIVFNGDGDECEARREIRENAALISLLLEISEKAQVTRIIVVDQDVILFSHGAFFQSVSGFVKSRNAPELRSEWAYTDYDGGMKYEPIDEKTHLFFAGL